MAYWITFGIRNYVSKEIKFVMTYVNEYKVLPQMTMEFPGQGCACMCQDWYRRTNILWKPAPPSPALKT